MTTDNWLTILLIITNCIAILISPIIGVLVAKSLSSHPQPAPETNQPKTLTQRMGSWVVRFLKSPWYISGLSIMIEIYLLRRELHSTAPITRSSIFLISEIVAAIFFLFLNMIFNFSSQWIWSALERHSETDAKIVDIVDALQESVAAISETVGAIDRLHTEIETQMKSQISQIHADKPGPGMFDKMLAAIKFLLKD